MKYLIMLLYEFNEHYLANYYQDGNHYIYDGNSSDLSANNRDRMGPRWHSGNVWIG